MLEHFELSIGGYFEGCHKVEINRQDDGSYQGIYTPPFDWLSDGPQKREFTVDTRNAKELNEFLSAKLRRWKKSYFAPVLDGTQWNLEYNENRYHGSNAFPRNFDFVLTWLVEKFELKELEGKIGIGKRWSHCWIVRGSHVKRHK